jgi:hypothetical protein
LRWRSFYYRAAFEIGSLAAALGGLDGIVFTAGIGENAAAVRAAICSTCGWLGLELDEVGQPRAPDAHQRAAEPRRRLRDQDRREHDDCPSRPHPARMFAFKGWDAVICSALAEEVGAEVRTAGDRTRRRRLSKLSCAGWVPHDRGFVSGLPRSKDALQKPWTSEDDMMRSGVDWRV